MSARTEAFSLTNDDALTQDGSGALWLSPTCRDH
jgi:hypothetical protein